jgi:hypothetical protein
MTDHDITTMDDPQFLAERTRVREELGRLPAYKASPRLTARYQELHQELLRRIRITHPPRPARRHPCAPRPQPPHCQPPPTAS